MDAAGGGRFRALLFANVHFPDDPHNLRDLNGPGNDVTHLGEALVDSSVGLFDASNVIISRDRPSHEIAITLEQFCRSAEREDVLFVYYSGHGVVPDTGGELLLCGRNSRTDLKISTTVSSAQFNAILATAAAETMVVVLDCCYSGNFPIKGDALAVAVAKGKGRHVLTSCRPNEFSRDGRTAVEVSTFTSHLIAGLREAPGRSGDSYLMFDDLCRFVHRRASEQGEPIPHWRVAGNGDIPVARRGPRRRTESRFRISPENIDIRGLPYGEQLPPRLVTVRGPTAEPDNWTAQSVADWLTLQIASNHFYISLAPRIGVNRANVDVVETETGVVRTVDIRVEVIPPDDATELTGVGAPTWMTPVRPDVEVARPPASAAGRTYPVVAAVELGSYDSTVVWREGDDDRSMVAFIDRWPGLSSYNPRVLSALLIDPEGAVVDWGYSARKTWREEYSMRSSAGFRYVTDFVSSVGPGLPGGQDEREAQRYRAFYLRRLCDLAREEILQAGYTGDQIRWCLVASALWSDDDRQDLREAAEEAGLPADHDGLLIVTGAEAAAYYAQISDDVSLGRPGRTLMIVQCGRTTTEATAYRVSESDGRRRLIEIGRASGGTVASQQTTTKLLIDYLNRRFGSDIVTTAIGSDPDGFEEVVEGWTRSVGNGMVESGPDGAPIYSRPYFVALPPAFPNAMHEAGLEALYRLAIAPDDIVRIWGPAAHAVVELVEDQLAGLDSRGGPGQTTVVLVGELAQDQYVIAYLAWAISGRADVVPSRDPRMATVLGALKFGADPQLVTAQLTAYSYGLSMAAPFEEGVDPSDKRLIGSNGQPLCTDRFQMLVPKGHAASDETSTLTFTPVHENQSAIEVTVYRSSSSEPRYVDEEGCEAVGTISIDLTGSMALPLAQRAVQLVIKLGSHEMTVTAVNAHTRDEVTTRMALDTVF